MVPVIWSSVVKIRIPTVCAGFTNGGRMSAGIIRSWISLKSRHCSIPADIKQECNSGTLQHHSFYIYY